MVNDKNNQPSSQSDDNVSVVIYTDLQSLEPIATEWDQLALESAHRSPQLSHAWLSCFFDVYCQTGEWLVVAAFHDHKLVAVLPLQKKTYNRWGVSLPCLQLPSNHQTQSVDGLVKSGYSDVLAHMYKVVFALHADCFCILYRLIDQVSPTLEWISQANSPYPFSSYPAATGAALETVGEYQHYLTSLSKNFRSSRNRHRNQLKKETGVSFVYEENGYDEDLFNSFLAIEDSGWKGRQGSSVASSEVDVQFYRKLAKKLAQNRWLSLQMLKSDSGVLAANFAVNFHQTTLLWKLGYSDQHAKMSPGSLLMDDLIRRCFESDVTRVDLMTNESWYKKWGMTFRPLHNLRVFRPGLTGKIISKMIKVKKRLTPFI